MACEFKSLCVNDIQHMKVLMITAKELESFKL